MKKRNTNRQFRLIATLLILASTLISLTGFPPAVAAGFEVRDLAPYVDPMIGATGQAGTGKSAIGPCMPNGSIVINPHSPSSPDGTGYSISDKISGFNNINTGSVYKYGNFLISPQTGLTCYDYGHDSDKANERAEAGYYSVDLTRYAIKTEITTSNKSVIYRMTYPAAANGSASLVIYPCHGIMSDNSYATVNYDSANNLVTGYVDCNGGWYYVQNVRVYYALKFSKAVTEYGMFRDRGNTLLPNTSSISGNLVGCYLKFSTGANEQVYAKMAISTKSEDNAKSFLNNEIPAWDFDGVKTANKNAWNQALSGILIDDPGATVDEKKIFYTALYHAMVGPKNRTGDCPWNYSGPYYDDHLCVWDTFRSNFPLMTLLKESMVRDTVQSFNEVFKHYGYANDALLGGQGDMIQGGDDVDVLIADAYAKGISGINWTDAYNLLKGHATNSGRSSYYRENDRGWVPYDTLSQMAHATASKTLEFAYNDFCLARVAEGLGFTGDRDRFGVRSGNWTSLWNPSVTSEGYAGFIQSKDINGSWVGQDPAYTEGPFSKHFYEGNSWTYSFFAPHQMQRVIDLMGGQANFVSRLQNYLNNHYEIYNEPCFLTPFLFVYGSRPDLASYYVSAKLRPQFTTQRYPGDEDSGAMSSLYVFAMLGFFPVAGQDLYLVNGPRFNKVTIQMENGNNVIINATNASTANIYVQSATLNGSALNKAWFTHGEIKNGATINFVMGSTASSWGTGAVPPPSYTYTAAPPVSSFADNFNDNSLGTSWSTYGGTWSESGQILSQTAAAGDPKKAIISNAGLGTSTDYTITAKVRVDSWTDGDSARAGVGLLTGTSNGCGYNLVFHNNHSTVQFLNDTVAWGSSYTFNWSNNSWYWFKLKMESGVLYGKVWQDGTGEPSNWPYSQAWSGRTGYPALNGGSTGVGSSTVSFDDLGITSAGSQPTSTPTPSPTPTPTPTPTTPPSSVFSDNFNDNALSSSWSVYGGTWSETGQILSQTSGANGDPRKAIISNAGLGTSTAYCITAKVRVDSWTDGDFARAGVSLFTGTGDGKGYNLLFHNNHSTVQFLDDGVIWSSSYTFNWSNNTWYWFKLKYESGTLYGKIWQDGSAEPGNWPYSQAWSGRTGYPALNGGSAGSGGGSSTASFDDVTVETIGAAPTPTPTPGTSVIDISHSGTTNVYAFGQAGDQVKRYQTFIATSYPKITAVEVKIKKHIGSSFTDVTVELFATSNNTPTGSALASATIPASSIGTSLQVLSANLTYTGLVNGNEYAIVLGQVTPSTGSFYSWVHGVEVSTDLQNGKWTGSVWVDESQLGDGWTKVYVSN
jgi:predicted alpha-1,2-mannosidase